MNVAILGAGVAGLSSAIALAQQGFFVRFTNDKKDLLRLVLASFVGLMQYLC